MNCYRIASGLLPLQELSAAGDGDDVLILITSQELMQENGDALLDHTPTARDARVCKAEMRHGCLCGTIVVPRQTFDGLPMAFGYLLTRTRLVLCDDTGMARSMIVRKQWGSARQEYSAGSLLCEFLEWLLAKDLHHLQELEDTLAALEDQALAGDFDSFTPRMTAVRKEIAHWTRYYTQMEDMTYALQENEGEIFTAEELRALHAVEKRVGRLQSEAQMLREYALQVRELFQTEIDIRQNRIMKILTIVTTIFLPLTLVTGWYGMNFDMPEVSWKYGYPAVIVVSVLVVCVCLFIMKKKRFW